MEGGRKEEKKEGRKAGRKEMKGREVKSCYSQSPCKVIRELKRVDIRIYIYSSCYRLFHFIYI